MHANPSWCDAFSLLARRFTSITISHAPHPETTEAPGRCSFPVRMYLELGIASHCSGRCCPADKEVITKYLPSSVEVAPSGPDRNPAAPFGSPKFLVQTLVSSQHPSSCHLTLNPNIGWSSVQHDPDDLHCLRCRWRRRTSRFLGAK